MIRLEVSLFFPFYSNVLFHLIYFQKSYVHCIFLTTGIFKAFKPYKGF